MKLRKRRQRTYVPFIALGLAVILFFLARGVWDVYQKEARSREKRDSIVREYEELSERKEFLEDEIARLKTSSGVEEEIRETYGLGKAGERVLILVEEEGEAAVSSSKDGFWNRIKRFFGRE